MRRLFIIYYLGIWPEDGWELWPKIDEGMGALLGLGAEGACGGGEAGSLSCGYGTDGAGSQARHSTSCQTVLRGLK